ncbi:XRE family transcriptional regulator [Lactobacillus amylovorus]|uniref:LexA family protein n=1 Tax=Lactobacillus amylovorus TaxID=1604 RepID=UPI0021A4FA5F|nr:XRE family transcriptional regulator [Lactobacillus amylovorus]MCT3595659.1 XRE family transcriptional regulator [Lactobacillus amylovorus]
MDLNKYIGERIRYFRNKRGWTSEELANKLGTSRVTVTRYETGTRKTNQDVLFKLADVFNVSINEFFPNQGKPSNLVSVDNSGMHPVRIPILGNIACGEPILAEQNIEGYTTELFDEEPDGTLFALKCQGDSMEPKIPNGATVIVREQPTVEDDEIAAVLVDDNEEATLKRIKHIGNQVMLMPENQKYDPIILNKENPGRILGKVIKVSYDL